MNQPPLKILVTGGTGYIGSHACLSLIESGHSVIALDNLSNSSATSLMRVEEMTDSSITFIEGDIRDNKLLDKLFTDHQIDAVLHFAGLKAVGESVSQPLAYYDNNVAGTVTLLKAMAEAGCKNIVFSSSATVYGDPSSVPIDESFPTGATSNPYGASKHMIEGILQDLYASDHQWNIGILRYFNPIGAHESGQIGEAPQGSPNNLLPYVTQVAVGQRPHVQVFGNDYPTPDGTGIRDYIHVMDLVEGHVAMLNKLQGGCGLKIYNLGTGRGSSVLDVINGFIDVNQVDVPYQIVERRPGDIAECWANPEKAAKELGWRATRNLDTMLRDAWNWQSNNPNGYE